MNERDNLKELATPRDLSASERLLVSQLLARRFTGSPAIRSQLAVAKVIAEGKDDTRTLIFSIPRAGVPPADSLGRVPVEGGMPDVDGVPIAVLLHVVDGYVTELEIYRVDGQPIRHDPLPALEFVTVRG